MIRVLIVPFLLTVSLFGYSYDTLLLKAQASIFPKIMLLDKKIATKRINNTIIYTIVYEEDDYQTALEVKRYIDTVFQGSFDEYPYEVQLVSFTELRLDTEASAFYILQSSSENIYKVRSIADKKGIISFSYDIHNLKYGLLFSMVMEKSIVLYLNKEYITMKNVRFVDSLLQMVKYIDKNNI